MPRAMVEMGRHNAMDLLRALERARHELTTLHGVYATDGFETFGHAQEEGLDTYGAWKVFVKECWQIDTADAVRRLDRAISGLRDLLELPAGFGGGKR